MSIGTKTRPTGIRLCAWSAASILTLLSGCDDFLNGPYLDCIGCVIGPEPVVLWRRDLSRTYRVYVCSEGPEDTETEFAVAAEIFHGGGPEVSLSLVVMGEAHHATELVQGDTKLRSERLLIDDYEESCDAGIPVRFEVKNPLFEPLGLDWGVHVQHQSFEGPPSVSVQIKGEPTRTASNE